MAPASLAHLWTLLQTGDAEGVLALFASPDASVLDDPLFFEAKGRDAITVRVAELSAFLRAHATEAKPRHLNTTYCKARVVAEHSLHLTSGLVWNEVKAVGERSHSLHLPVAAVGYRNATASNRFDRIHLYFGTWAFDGNVVLRKGFVTKESLSPNPLLDEYFNGLEAGDVEKAVGVYEVDGYFREPAGNAATGTDALLKHYTHILSIGGITVERLTETVGGGGDVAYEIQTVKWGPKKMEVPQAGLAVYILGDNGKNLFTASRRKSVVEVPSDSKHFRAHSGGARV